MRKLIVAKAVGSDLLKNANVKVAHQMHPLAVFLELFGDRWSLRIVSAAMQSRSVTFKELLEANEGIATNILTARLRNLEANGIIISNPDPRDLRKRNYVLTPKGTGLAPVIRECSRWASP